MTFLTWVLVGVLAGAVAGVVLRHGGHGLKSDVGLALVGSVGMGVLSRALGLTAQGGMLWVVVVVSIGAAIPIVAQRRAWPSQRLGQDRGDVWVGRGLAVAVVVLVAWMTLVPARETVVVAATTADRAYRVTPDRVTVTAGIVTGEVMGMKIVERVEPGSGRVVDPAKLKGTVVLKNGSTNETVRLVGGLIRYLDARSQPIPLEDNRTDPALAFGGDADRLDPGQETVQSFDVEFPAAALETKRLGHIRLELAYVVLPYRKERADFAVTIDGIE